MSDESDISELETRAEELRTKFFATVEALDARGHGAVQRVVGRAKQVKDEVKRDVEEVKEGVEEATEAAVPIALAAGALLLGITGVAAVWWLATRARKRRELERASMGWPWRRVIVVRAPEGSLVGAIAGTTAAALVRAALPEIAARLAPVMADRARRVLRAVPVA